MIFNSFLLTFAVNVVGDLVLIPFYKNEGAALAFLLACLVQGVFYLANDKSGLKGSFYKLAICTACAFFSGLAAKALFPNLWLAAIMAVVFYGVSLLITMQLKRDDRAGLIGLLNW
jgi:peptidoglycan biosynthesis protein MviN/MurJ (putative lipid II flippase)